MKIMINRGFKAIAIAISAISFFSSCNKDLPEAEPIVTSPPSGSTILETIRANGATYSYLDSAIARASNFNSPAGKLNVLLNDKNTVFTVFAPDNDAFQRSFQLLGLPTGVSTLKGFRPGYLDTLLRYHLIGGQEFTISEIPTTFPNSLYLQSGLVLQAPSPTVPPGYRMPVFLSKQGNTSFANNIPLVQTDIDAANGVIHRASFILLPPQQVLAQRIASDPDLTYLWAAIKKADEGDPNATFQSALANPAANLTVLAPSNAAFQQLLTGQITLALIGMGLDAATAAAQAAALASTPAVFTNPALASVLTPTVVAGIVAYHLLAEPYGETFQGIRVFSNNIPSNDVNAMTFVNLAVKPHPGVTLKATYGFSGVIALTAKGLGNATPASVFINPTPAPNGTSDQLYINGVLHKIDQVLLPQ
jgi:uncharacterized surface protein with fasciclin (FAS1) repeats